MNEFCLPRAPESFIIQTTMSKWYRPSLSLAGKCRLGFAAAVLLIVGAALFVPYRWMDKLVEQGKLELAQVEVQRILERHFRPVRDPELATKNPPLALGAGEKQPIKPGHWTLVESDSTSGHTEGSPLFVVSGPQVNPTEKAGGEGDLLQARPLTKWITVPAAIGVVQTTVSEVEKDSSIPEAPTTPGTVETPPQERTAVNPVAPAVLTGDNFEKRGIREFLRQTQKQEIFKLYQAEPDMPGMGGSPQGNEGMLGSLHWVLPGNQSGRYLRAVRANRSCLLGGCHGASGVATVASESPAKGPPIFSEGQLVGVISVFLPTGQTNTTLIFNRIFIVAGGLLASICAVVVFYLITQRFILQPVRSLREAADQVTVPASEAKENPDARESWQAALNITETIKTGDEFERLAEAFHQMLARLKLAQDRLRETNRALDLKLGELQAANVALFESNRLKSEFLANVSHELRTPLNAIIGFAGIIKEQAEHGDDKKTVRYAANVLESGKLLLNIINDLLDLAKIEAGKVEVRWEKCSVLEIAEALLNFTRPLVEDKQQNVNLTVDQNIGLIETDPGKLQQILFNLLSNAIKFTPQRGRIDVEAKLIDVEHFYLRVTDTGPGIPEKDREKIFEKFRQLDASVTREHSGTGLGLAIVKELVNILGGTIAVEGEEGKGSIFTVLLPVRPPLKATAA
jgi:two-component system, NarL family, sensor histidine kinase BarA